MRVLHILSQRPSLTGSGITLDALVRHAGPAGWEQRVVVGVPGTDPHPEVGGLEGSRIHPLVFGRPPVEFDLPGMSDVMPYPSSRFSQLTDVQIAAYQEAWRFHLRPVLESFKPQVIHSHHVWLLSALLKELAPGTPVATHCHATGLRQMELCPHLAETVRSGCRKLDAFAVLHRQHAVELEGALAIDRSRIHHVGAGYRDDLFDARGRLHDGHHAILYVGKYSAAKGLPWLIDAFEKIALRRPRLRLEIVGGGAGGEATEIRARLDRLGERVVQHGQLSQPQLAEVARRTSICVLPSFYEGLPLVLVEALACGNRLVATALPGINSELAPRLGEALTLVDPPRLHSVDRPEPADLPAFVDALEHAIERALGQPPLGDPEQVMPGALRHFTWRAVFERVEALWRGLL
jgi:glycosyltransferase involved in cell wall biosynthesis